MTVFGYNPKAGLRHVHIVDATIAYKVSETGQLVTLVVNKAIEIKGLDHHLLCLMQCHVNGVLINEVPKFLVPIPHEKMHAIQLENPFDATHPIIIPFQLNRVTSYFRVRMFTREECEEQNILKIKLTTEAPP